jgi:hypothetical protein
LRELEAQIAEKEDLRRRDQQNQSDWWEKRQEVPYKMPNKPHPSQVSRPAACLILIYLTADQLFKTNS